MLIEQLKTAVEKEEENVAKNNGGNVTWHVPFASEEDQRIRQRAEEAGISVVAYIRQQALHGVVRCIDWEALKAHGEILSDVAMWVYLFINNLEELERSMHESDLAQIKNYLEEMLRTEKDVYQFIVGTEEMDV